MQTAVRRLPQHGVTLIELLVTLSILVIVLTIGVSGMTTLVKRNQRATEVNAMLGHLNFARAQAIMRASTVVVCPVGSGNPTAGCDAGADVDAWNDGYAVLSVDSGEVLRLQRPSTTLRIRSGQAGGGSNGFAFKDDGTLSSGSGYKTNGSIYFCDADADGIPGRRVVVSRIGRIRLQEDAGICTESEGD